MNKNTKAKFATAHSIFRAFVGGKSSDAPCARCTSHQPRKSKLPKVARSAATISKMNG